jgi:hypothetical protein
MIEELWIKLFQDIQSLFGHGKDPRPGWETVLVKKIQIHRQLIHMFTCKIQYKLGKNKTDLESNPEYNFRQFYFAYFLNELLANNRGSTLPGW